MEGYPLEVTPATKLVAANGSDLSGAQIPAAVTTNVWATYTAVRGAGGALEATRVAFEPNSVDADEKGYREREEPEYTAPDPAKHKPGLLKFGVHMPVTFELLPDPEVQNYVSRIGNRLVPQYQKDLPDSDPTKINFRFYAVKMTGVWEGPLTGAVDLPNGVVLSRARP